MAPQPYRCGVTPPEARPAPPGGGVTFGAIGLRDHRYRCLARGSARLVAAVLASALVVGCGALGVTSGGDSGPSTMSCTSLQPAADASWRGHSMWDFRPTYAADQTFCTARDGSTINLVATADDPRQAALLDHEFELATRERLSVPMVDAAGVLESQYGNRPQQAVENDGSGTTVVVPATVPRLRYAVVLLARRGGRYVRLTVVSQNDESLSPGSFDVSGAVEVAEDLLAAGWHFPGCTRAACDPAGPG
jgi:hypothetical protein